MVLSVEPGLSRVIAWRGAGFLVAAGLQETCVPAAMSLASMVTATRWELSSPQAEMEAVAVGASVFPAGSPDDETNCWCLE